MCARPVVEPRILEGIRRHVRGTETGAAGILIGRPTDGEVIIEQALPAEEVEEHDGEIVFLPATWERAYEVAVDELPGSRIVGWYHSHPGTGVRLSDYDRRLHTLLFPEASTVALVLDPLADQAAWYAWILDAVSGEGSTGLPAGPAAVRRRPSAGATAAVLVGVVAAGSLGWLVGRSTAPERRPGIVIRVPDPTLRRRLAQARDQLHRIEAELRQAKDQADRADARLQAAKAELAAARRALRAARAAHGVTYRVRPGDSLSALAASFYGDPQAWPRIWHANERAVPNPDRVPVGAVLTIPG
jgi:nucleoid-associated protein YgaU